MSIGENIKKARLNKNWSQKELADAISNEEEKFGNTAISNWENGISKPDADTIMSLCEALEVDANYLLDWEEKQASYDIKNKLKSALKENKFFDGEDLTEENFNKLLKYIEKNKEFIIDKKE